MITKLNIIAYIGFMYRMKNGTEAPTELLNKWASLNESEIQQNLQQLYAYWQFDAEKIRETERLFSTAKTVNSKPVVIEKSVQPVGAQTSTPLQTQVAAAPVKAKRPLTRYLLGSIVAVLLLGGVYLMWQYMQFQKMHRIYTLTQNVAVRDEQGKTVANFALLPNNKTKTYTELIAHDLDIYPLSIDSSAKKYDFRKVLFEPIGFFDYLRGHYQYGFVNANYVIEDKTQFDEYNRIFGKFQASDNNRLKLAQRKIIYHALKNSKHNKNSYLISTCKNANKKFAGFISNELIDNTRIQIIAKLEDGYFYSLSGDLNSEEFDEPRRIQLDGEDCRSDFLFRYISPEAGFKIYNCSGAPINIRCQYDDERMIVAFETEEAPEPEIIQPLIDTLQDVINDIVN